MFEVFFRRHIWRNVTSQDHDIFDLIRLELIKDRQHFFTICIHAGQVCHRFGVISGEDQGSDLDGFVTLGFTATCAISHTDKV